MYTRKTIDPKTRQLLIIAACVARGVNDNSLKAHMDTAMDYGSTPDEIKELLLYTAAGAGFPTCFWGLRCLGEAVKRREQEGKSVPVSEDPIMITPDEERMQVGENLLSGLDVERYGVLKGSVGEVFPTFYEHLVSFGYGDVFARTCLDERIKHLFMITTLVSLDKASELVEMHIKACADAGVTLADFEEVLLVFSVYIGFASAFDFAKAVMKVYQVAL